MATLRFVSEDEVRAVMRPRDLVATQESAFQEIAQRTDLVVPRAIAKSARGSLVAMPAWLPDRESLGAKVLSAMPDNLERGLPVNQAVIVMFDSATGSPTTVIDAGWITAARTGAVAAVATNALANDDARSLAVLGSGPVADWAVRCVVATRAIHELRLWSRTRERAVTLTRSLRAEGITEGIDVHVIGSPTAAIAGAEIVVTATSSATSLVGGRDLRPGCHVSVLGGADGGREIDLNEIANRRLVIDSWRSAWLEAGALRAGRGGARLQRRAVVADLGSVLVGRLPGRTKPTDTTVFVSAGMAVQDIALAAEVLRRLDVE